MDVSLLGTLQQTQSNASHAKMMQAGNALKGQSQNEAKTESKTDVAARDFEAVFISQMLAHMFDGIETNEMFGGGASEKIYKSMMVEEYGKIISQSGGIGVSDSIKSQLIAMQAKGQ